jgi:Pro-kumamolisin, activation domain/Bacterial Ig-like domain (group 3)
MSTRRSGVCKPFLFLFLLFSLNLISTSAQVPARVIAPVDNALRVTLAGNIHPLARAEFDRGAVAGSQPMPRILLLLQRSDAQEAALQTFLEQQQDKGSPNYHQWLTPAEFGAQYGPADSDVQAVTQWLESQGFTIAKVYSGKTVIEFSGTAAQVQAAFGTPIHNFEVNGKLYVANATNPQIPAALAPVIAGIVSLNNFPRQSHVRVAGQARKIAGHPGLQPQFTYPLSGGGTFYGVGPGDFATIYNSKNLIGSGNDGTGQTIAVVGETNINVVDVQDFRQTFGLSSNFTSTNIILNGEDPGITSTDEEGEADLDTQWSGAVAPGATIKFVVSASTPASQGIDLSALYIIEYNLAGVMSESYGACESALGVAGNAFYNSLWEQAAAQGITVILSAGDGGSAGCDDFNTATVATQGLAVSGLASTPYNISLGGTDFDDVNDPAAYWSATNNGTTSASALSYIPEIPWNQNCAQLGLTGCGSTAPQGSLNIVAGSGGASNVYSKPKWQMGVTGMPNDSHRDLPDVSLFASPGFDNSGYIICQSDVAGVCNQTAVSNFEIVGGTSVSAPAFAGIMALVNQYQSAHGGSARQGNANPVLYSLAKKSGASCASSATEASGCIFNDVTHGNSYLLPYYPSTVGTNSVPCQGASLNCSSVVTSTNGVLVEPTNSKIEAWTAAPGYDLATGLGSVNVNNLATNWGTVNTVPTSTTLTLNPTTGITHGTAENVTVNVTVTPTSGTASGNVSLIATLSGPSGSTAQGLDQFTLNSSGQVVNATTNSLPGGGSYQVYAHYAGDGTNAPSDSAPVTVTVGKESSQTFIVVPTFDSNGNQVNGNATSVPYGSNYFIRMYVTDKNGVASATGPPAPACYQENQLTCPTGTVTLTDGGNVLGTGGGGAGIYNLNSAGYTRDLSPSAGLLGGTHDLAASYSGDNSYQSSTSAATTLTVAPGITQAQILNTVSSIVEGQQIYVSGQVTASSPFPLVTLATPTGSLALYDGNTALPGVSVTAGGGQMNAFLATTFSTPGPHSITARYSGDSNYAASTSTPFVVDSLYPVTVAETASATTITYGQTITVTAVISSGVKGPAMSGQVQFMGLYQTGLVTTTAGTDANGNEILTATATTTPQNSENLVAWYSGDSTYGPANSPGLSITVNIPNFSLGPAGITVQPQAGQAGTAQITVTPANPTQCTVTLSPGPGVGSNYFSGYTLAINPAQVTLNGAPVTATISFTPNTATPSIVQKASARHASILPVKRGNWWLLSFAAAVAAVFWFTRSARRKKLRTALALSIASLVFLALGCGGGGGSSGGSGGGSGGPPQATSIALTTTNAKIPINTPGTITATVTASKPLTGTISFYNFGQLIDGPIPAYSGQAQMNIEALLPGQYQLTAAYSGDSANQSSTSTPLAQVVTGTISLNFQATTGSGSMAITRYLDVAIGVQ